MLPSALGTADSLDLELADGYLKLLYQAFSHRITWFERHLEGYTGHDYVSQELEEFVNAMQSVYDALRAEPDPRGFLSIWKSKCLSLQGQKCFADGGA